MVQMITQAYRNYLRSPQWKAKREQVFARYGKKCRACGSTKKIQCHHLSYDNLYHEPLTDLIPICQDCHREITRLTRRRGRKTIREVTLAYIATKKRRLNQ